MLCGISKISFEIPHKIFYAYSEKMCSLLGNEKLKAFKIYKLVNIFERPPWHLNSPQTPHSSLTGQAKGTERNPTAFSALFISVLLCFLHWGGKTTLWHSLQWHANSCTNAIEHPHSKVICSQKILHSFPVRTRYWVSFVSSISDL